MKIYRSDFPSKIDNITYHMETRSFLHSINGKSHDKWKIYPAFQRLTPRVRRNWLLVVCALDDSYSTIPEL